MLQSQQWNSIRGNQRMAALSMGIEIFKNVTFFICLANIENTQFIETKQFLVENSILLCLSITVIICTKKGILKRCG
jgi:hypothetical protein